MTWYLPKSGWKALKSPPRGRRGYDIDLEEAGLFQFLLEHRRGESARRDKGRRFRHREA